MIHRFAAAASCAAALLVLPVRSQAHAFLSGATPAVGGTVRAAPPEVRIDFTEGVEPAFSTIVVTDAQGARVDRGAVRLAGGDAHLAIGLTPLAAGRYLVHWRVVATDSHRTEGSFRFTVAP